MTSDPGQLSLHSSGVGQSGGR